MTFLDATSPELAQAAAEAEFESVDALRSFLMQFDAGSVSRYLSGEILPGILEDEPAFFRYLVLTCVVAVNDVDGVDKDTHNFRIRLGQTLGVGELHSVGAVNAMWRSLVAWSDRQRSMGRPVREVILPDPGNMTLIGYAVKMAFPAWRDRSQFTALMKRIPESIRRSPRRLVGELLRAHHHFDIPSAIRDALKDFARSLNSGQSMLSGHRFWALVSNIEETFAAEDGKPRRTPSLRIEMHFGGYDQDIPEFRILSEAKSHSSGASRGHIAGGSWADVQSILRQYPHCGVSRSTERGYAVFKRSAGYWLCDDAGPGNEDFCLIVSHRSSPARQWRLATTWSEIAPDWSISDRVDASEILSKLIGAGFVPNEFSRPALSGGLLLKRNVYLGRPRMLPELSNLPKLEMSLRRLSGATGTLTIGDFGNLDCSGRLDGIWRIGLAEGRNRLDIPVAFEADAHEPAEYADLGEKREWRPDREMADEQAVVFPTFRAPRFATAATTRGVMEDIGEAIFTRAASGWRDGELISLVKRLLPSSNMVWDVLRSFQESGWLDTFVSKRWRSRMWLCRPPSLVGISEDGAVVDGATANVVISRLSDALAVVGGRLHSVVGVSEYAPRSVYVSGTDIARLCEMLGWPSLPLSGMPAFDPALQWIEDPRTPDGRTHASSWSYELGLFLERQDRRPTVSVERWVRARGDEADLYVVRRGGDVVRKTASRVNAILEGHRLNRTPLFSAQENQLTRLGRSGHLPCAIARLMRLRSLQSSGPRIGPDGSWTYAYATDAGTVAWLRRYLGPGILAREAGHSDLQTGMVEWRHRGGRRPGWNLTTCGSKR